MMRSLSVTSALLFLAVAAGAQQTLHVPDDYPSISAAVAAASNGDRVLVGPGTYREGAVVSFAGKIIEVRSEAGPEVTIVDGEGDDRCFRFTGGETRDTLLEGFTLLNGQAPTGTGTNGRDGGAVLIQGASPTIRTCSFVNGRADYGEDGGSPGYRGGHGGAIHINTGSPWVERCSFQSNRAGTGGRGATGSTGSGGSLFSAPGSGGTGAAGGRGGHGGAVHLNTGSPVFVNCYFSFNESGQGGVGGSGGRGGNAGAWAGRGGDGGRGGNGGDGGDGGAIYVTAGTLEVLNCTFWNNSRALRAPGGAGGTGGSSALGSGSTGSGGSLGEFGSWRGIYMTAGEVRNSILWNQGAGGQIPPGNTVSYSSVYEGYIGPGNLSDDPRLSSGNLLSSSPCIDAGDNSQVPSGMSIDFRGWPRFIDDRNTVDVGLGSGAIVDMGASEFASSYVVPYGCGNPGGSLSLAAGAPTIGSSITLRLDRPDAPHQNGDVLAPALAARAGLIVGTAPLAEGCGVQLPGGFLQVDISQPWSRQWSDQAWTGAAVDVELAIPADTSLIGTSLFVQGAFLRLSSRGGLAGGMRLTEALELVVGP